MGPGVFYLGEEELGYLKTALERKELSRYNKNHMSFVDLFEEEVKQRFFIQYALGMNSCTSALYSGIKALHLNRGDEVLVPSFAFVATIAAVVLNGLIPIFVNIDESLSIDPKDIESHITPKTKALVVAHMLGNPCNMTAVVNICKQYNLLLVEDVAQAFGGSYKGKRLGTFGAFGASSLNVFKIITAGDGGIFLTNDKNLYNETFSFHDHGFYESNNRIITENSIFGLNLRMHELTGCVAYAQIKKIDTILSDLHDRKVLFKSILGENEKYKFRLINDVEGDCSQVVVLIFDSKKLADTFCRQNKTQTLFASQKHCYSSMFPILNKELGNYPYSDKYLDKTGNILQRSVVLSVGMQDSYIGSDVGVDLSMTNSLIVKKADEIRHIISNI